LCHAYDRQSGTTRVSAQYRLLVFLFRRLVVDDLTDRDANVAAILVARVRLLRASLQMLRG
jgi:hypothetical protein